MNRRVLVVAITLVLSFGLRIWLSATPLTPKRESLAGFPKQAGAWTMVGETALDESIAGVLKADDYVMRRYREGTGQQVDLFIAYYKTQKAGESMHSPKNCLPGSGWGILQSDEVALQADDPLNSAMISRYLIEKNGERSLVLYWYQANGRVIASEYWGKIYLVWDALRTGRRDGAIVRFVVSIRKGSDGRAELQSGLDMARTTMPFLSKYVPD
jgi:EpsI family protein